MEIGISALEVVEVHAGFVREPSFQVIRQAVVDLHRVAETRHAAARRNLDRVKDQRLKRVVLKKLVAMKFELTQPQDAVVSFVGDVLRIDVFAETDVIIWRICMSPKTRANAACDSGVTFGSRISSKR